MGGSDPIVQSSGLSVTSTGIEGGLSPTCLKNLRCVLLVRSLPRSPENELGHHPGCAFPATPRKARVPTLSLMASPSYLSPNAHQLLRCSSFHGRDGSSEGRPAPGGESAEAHPSLGLRVPPAGCRPHRPLTERWPGEALDTCRHGTHHRRESVTQGREGSGQPQEEGEAARVSEPSSPPHACTLDRWGQIPPTWMVPRTEGVMSTGQVSSPTKPSHYHVDVLPPKEALDPTQSGLSRHGNITTAPSRPIPLPPAPLSPSPRLPLSSLVFLL